MSVRAKFRVKSVARYDWGKTNGRIVVGEEVIAAPVGPHECEENKAFFAASPSGEFKITISNPDAQGFFQTGRDYYLDFSEVPEAAPVAQ